MTVKKCILDKNIYEWMKTFLDNQYDEMGGFAIGYRKNQKSYILGIIFPHDTKNTPTYCEFDTNYIHYYRLAFRKIKAEEKSGNFKLVTAWVHTHPRLSCFLSSLDNKTFKDWYSLDPDMLAMVIDVFKEEEQEKIKVFNSKLKEIACDIEVLGEQANIQASREIMNEFINLCQEKALSRPKMIMQGNIELYLSDFYDMFLNKFESFRNEMNEKIDEFKKKINDDFKDFKELLRKKGIS